MKTMNVMKEVQSPGTSMVQVGDPEKGMSGQVTLKAFSTEWGLPQVQRMFRTCSTPLACIDSLSPTLWDIRQAFGEDYAQAYVEGWIVNLRLFLNIGKAMTDEQTFDTAMLIVDTYGQINVADINLIFKRAKLGEWGQLYDRLDGQVVLGWFRSYFNERASVAAERSIRQANSMSFRVEDASLRIQSIVDNALNKSHLGTK